MFAIHFTARSLIVRADAATPSLTYRQQHIHNGVLVMPTTQKTKQSVDPDGRITINFGDGDVGESDKPADQDWDRRLKEREAPATSGGSMRSGRCGRPRTPVSTIKHGFVADC
jgi:hypothetical protein